jgi:hypothetical protein
MNTFKKRKVITVLVRILLLSLTILGFGCGGDGGDGGGTDTESYVMDAYFPLSSSWETDDWTLFIDVRDHLFDGVMTKAMVDTRQASVRYWTNDENGLRLHGVLERDDGEPGGLRTQIHDPPITFADDVCKFGDPIKETEFTINGDEYLATSELVDVGNVSVIAGDFNNCLVFEINMYKMVDGTYEWDFGETWWLAKNVGLVKVVNDANSNDSLLAGIGKTRQLLRYYISSSQLTPDEQAYIELTKNWIASIENENQAIGGFYSADYF